MFKRKDLNGKEFYFFFMAILLLIQLEIHSIVTWNLKLIQSFWKWNIINPFKLNE